MITTFYESLCTSSLINSKQKLGMNIGKQGLTYRVARFFRMQSLAMNLCNTTIPFTTAVMLILSMRCDLRM